MTIKIFLALIVLINPNYVHSGAPTKQPLIARNEASQTKEAMVFIGGGEFTAGAVPEIGFREGAKFYNDCKIDWFTDETPHKEMVNSFFIDPYEVTQDEFKSLMGTNPSKFRGDIYPVDSVTWDEANAYAKSLGNAYPQNGSGNTQQWGDKPLYILEAIR